MRNLCHSFHSQIPPLLRTPVISSLPAKPQTAKMANRLVDDGKRVAGGGRSDVAEGVTAIALHFSSSTFHSFNFTRSPFCFFLFFLACLQPQQMALGYLTFANASSRCRCHRRRCGANGAWQRPSQAKTKATVGGRFLITNHWRFPQRRRKRIKNEPKRKRNIPSPSDRNYILCSISPTSVPTILLLLSFRTFWVNNYAKYCYFRSRPSHLSVPFSVETCGLKQSASSQAKVRKQ